MGSSGKYKIEEINIGDEIVFKDKNAKEGISKGSVISKFGEVAVFVVKQGKIFTENKMVAIADIKSITGK